MIELQHVSAGYGAQDVVRDVSFTAPNGQLTALIGPNGSGKTTLLRAMTRTLPCRSGNILLDDRSIASYGRKEFARTAAFMPQSRPVPGITVRALVAHGRFPYLGFSRRMTAQDTAAVEQAMRRTGTLDWANRDVRALSGGERQRVYLAMALAQGGTTILLDEPGAFLDVRAQFELLDLLRTDDPMGALEAYRGHNELLDTGIDELSTVVRYMAAFGVPQDHFMVDLTIARGLDYYTGTVYETVMLDHPEIGSICSGGRYDNLAEYYTDKQLPGVGISIGLTRLFFVLEDQGYLNQEVLTAPADVLVLPMTEDLAPAISLATQLRQAGIRTQIQAERKKFKQKLSYADKLRIPYAVILGEDEIREGLAAVKDLATGEQVKLAPGQAAAHILAGLDRLNQGTPILDRV